ncbi:MAG: cytochrome c [Acidimicrobiia bacterium]|nr:cytochrome c [Acidimicrobiia bacterium]MDH3397427.1 cytochrome c [Acidimicrobiia bacterium]MDH5616309.1 cytochrome c [Acidimicrobiia bacterium]
MTATLTRRRGLVALLVLVVLSTNLLAACGAGLDENASGEQVYNARCSSCHRKDLSGGIGPALGPGSEAVDRPLEYYEITINSGKGRMPSFGSSLTDEQISRVIDYVIAFQDGS